MYLGAIGCTDSISISLNDINSYPIYSATGNHYQVGYEIGKSASKRITNHINDFPDINAMRLYTANRGAAKFEDLVKHNTDLYPLYIDELQGLSDGSGAQLSDLLLLSLKHEILHLMRKDGNISDNEPIKSRDLQCSTVLAFRKRSNHTLRKAN